MLSWLIDNWAEITGASLAMVFVFLEVREKWLMWIFGIMSSAFYIFIFLQSKVYAQMGLQVYFLAINFYGLYYWRRKAVGENNVPDTIRLRLTTGVVLALTALVSFALIRWVLVVYTDSSVASIDAFLAALSLVASWMVARKILEHWFIWIFVDFFSAGLYIYLNMYPTSLLYLVYAFMAIWGFCRWKRNMIVKVS